MERSGKEGINERGGMEEEKIRLPARVRRQAGFCMDCLCRKA